MGWYIELHCDGPKETGGGCPYGASEEGPQGNSVKGVSAEARRLGWYQINGHWRCAECVRDVRCLTISKTRFPSRSTATAIV